MFYWFVDMFKVRAIPTLPSCSFMFTHTFFTLNTFLSLIIPPGAEVFTKSKKKTTNFNALIYGFDWNNIVYIFIVFIFFLL